MLSSGVSYHFRYLFSWQIRVLPFQLLWLVSIELPPRVRCLYLGRFISGDIGAGRPGRLPAQCLHQW
jgi:hypothetical protein